MAKKDYFSRTPLLLVSNKSDKTDPNGPSDLTQYFGIQNLMPQHIVDFKVGKRKREKT